MPKVASANAFFGGKLHDQLHVLRQQQNILLCFVGIFFSLIYVTFLRNVNENERNYEEKNERENENADDAAAEEQREGGREERRTMLKTRIKESMFQKV